MFLLYKLCFIILFKEYYSLKDTLRKKNLQLVEILKEDLQRNNDDYAGIRRSFSQTNNTIQVMKSEQSNNKVNYTALKEAASHNGNNTNEKQDVRIKIIDNIRRRVNDALKSKEVINNETDPQRRAAAFSIPPIIKIPPKTNKDSNIGRAGLSGNKAKLFWNDMHDMLLNHNKLNQYRMQLLLNKTNLLATQPTIMTTKTTIITTEKQKEKRVRKNKMMKLKKFIQENKGLLKDFISSNKRTANIMPATPVAQQMPVQKLSKPSGGRQHDNILREDTNSSINKYNLMELPNADVLDMFPAKGGRIHSKRVNGHLCHRHVLIPEGPKYNSEGRIYLPPHAAARVAHEYNATEVPALLLPKCCNCCHKSVLGCE